MCAAGAWQPDPRLGPAARFLHWNGGLETKIWAGKPFWRNTLSWSFDHVGWMTRSVADAKLLLRVWPGRILGPDDNPDPLPKGKNCRFIPVPPRSVCSGNISTTTLTLRSGTHRGNPERFGTRRCPGRATGISGEFCLGPFDDQLIFLTVEAASVHQPMLEKKAEPFLGRIFGTDRKRPAYRCGPLLAGLENRLQFIADTRAPRPALTCC
ncbi:MAG: hypothetical protein Ct9H300mP16_00860 [Pseudomonadota bacterium]|nr:MAG: hypothetical protein Ct9H300mP16_00860 [Pseudomonadota bacterium]